MHVCGVPGQQDTAAAVGGCLPGHVGEPGDPPGAAKPVVRPVGGDECLAKLVHAGVAGVFDVSVPEHGPVRPSALQPVDGTDATTLGAHADLRLLVHLDLGDQPAGRGIQPGEVDTGCLADQAASSVAADEILRPDRRVPGHLDIDAGVVLSEAHHLAATKDRSSGLPGGASPAAETGETAWSSTPGTGPRTRGWWRSERGGSMSAGATEAPGGVDGGHGGGERELGREGLRRLTA